MVCGYVVLATYLWPSLTVLFFGAGTALHTLTLFGKFSFTVDPIIMGIALLCFVILAVVTICRRKVVGLIRVINLALAIAMAIALIYPGTITATNVDLVVNLHGNLHKFSISYYYLVLILLLFATIGISIFRLNAKKFYQFEAVLTGVVFVVVAAIFIEYITVNEKARWLMFTQNPVAANVLLVGALVAFLLSVENVYLVLHRRKQLKKQREAVLAAIDEEEKTEQPETPEEGAPAAYSQAPYQPYPAPYNAPAYPQPAPYYPQPMPQMMQMSMTPAGPVYPPMPPVIVQQAPATPPVVVLQLPGNGQQQPVQVSAMQQYPYPQQAYAPAYPQPMPAQPQPALQEPEPPASDFARRMMVLADEPAEQPEKPQQPAPMPQQQAAVQPVETSAARPQHVGPHDAFLDTLTQQEFTEFNSLFIEGTHGDLGLPKYAVGKDNKAFFAKVFAALGKFRPYASDGLLDKLLSQKA